MKTLSQADREKLESLNKAVTDAIAERREWMDSKMAEYAEVPVGEPIYDIFTGGELGTVVALYRYWRGRNDLLDTSLDVNYEYKTRGGIMYNTSSQPGKWFGNKETALKHISAVASTLK